jgi:DGQHR domain-containing protein
LEHRYRALSFAPRKGHQALYMVAARADEIVLWADAPHKQVGVRAGYQRELDERRTDGIRSYVELSGLNILPSAALIAVRAENFSVQEENGQTIVTIRDENLPEDHRRQILMDDFKRRLSQMELASVASVEAYERSVATDNEEIESVDEGLETIPPESYLAGLYAELLDYENATVSRKKELDDLAVTLTIPGLIIDGQHRIFGAKEAPEFDVMIPVVLLPGLAISEQVFHFYVLNNKAKPLDKRQLRSIISTSLTKQEIDDLYDRFRKSGLRADEAQWTYRIGSDEDSPFRNLVSLRLRGDVAPIDDNVMDQVVARFIKMPRSYNLLKKGIEWDDGDSDYSRRLGLFYALWRAVRDSYPDAWQEAADRQPSAQLFQKVALLQLQEYVLKTLKLAVQFTKESPLSGASVLYGQTRTALERIPQEFFQKEWKKKQLDTNVGRAYFLEQLEAVASQEGKFLGNFGLFKD